MRVTMSFSSWTQTRRSVSLETTERRSDPAIVDELDDRVELVEAILERRPVKHTRAPMRPPRAVGRGPER
jgi:hypothetical protein